MGKLPYVRLLRYGSAILAVIVTLIIALVLRPVLDAHLYSAFYVPIIVVALYAGFGPGLLAIVLSSAVIAYFFLLPTNFLALDNSRTALELAIFILMGVLLNVLSSSRYNIEGLFVRQDESFRTILSSVGDAVITTDTEGRVRFMNSVAEKLTGWSLEEARGQRLNEVFNIINEYSRQAVPDPVQKVLREGTVVGLANHTILITKQGAEKPIDDSAAPIRNSYGLTSGAVLIFRDITERRRIEAEQNERQRLQSRLAAIVESSEDAIIGLDLSAVITSWNKGAQDMYGYTPEETVGKSVSVLVPPGSENDVPKILERFKHGESIKHYETRRKRKDGVLLDVSLTVSPIYDSQGKVIGASKIARDITERKRADERERFLATASDVMASSLEYEVTLSNIARLAVPNMADWCSVDMLQDDGTIKRLAVAHVDPAKVAWAYELSQKYPVDMNATSGLPQVLRSGQATFYPDITDAMLAAAAVDEEQLELIRNIGFSSAMTVPMLVQGETLGVISFIYAESRRHYSEADLGFAQEVARRAAVAVENARLFAERTRLLSVEQAARAQAEAAQKRVAFLAEVSTLLASSLDYQQTLSTLARLIIPELADWCGIDMLQDDGSLQRLAVEHIDPEKVALAYELQRRYPTTMGEPGSLQTVLHTGQPQLIPVVTDDMLVAAAKDADYLDMLRKIGFSSGMTVPLVAHDRILGAITLAAAESGRHYTEDDLAFAQEVARRAAAAVDNAHLYSEVDRQRERFRTTLASIGDGVITTDTQGKVTLVNAVAADLMGMTPDEAIGQPLVDVFHIVNLFTRAEVENPVTRVLREGKIVGLANHTVLLSCDGREIPISDSGAPIRDSQGNMLGVVLVFRDDTERYQAEATRRQLASIVQYSEDAIIAEDLNGNITTWNEAAQRLFGYNSEEILGKPINVLVPVDRLEELNDIFDALRQGQHVSHCETVRLNKNGTRIDVSITLSPLKDEEGNIVGFSKIARDIREQKRIQEELRSSKEQLEVIIANLGSGITVLKPDGQMIYANDIAARINGYSSAEELIHAPYNRVMEAFDVTDESGKPLLADQRPRAIALQTRQSAEKIMGYHDRSGGEEHWSIVKSTPLLDEQGDVQLVITFIQDITELKRIQMRLQLLSEVGTLVSTSLDYEIMLEKLAHLLVPGLADNFVIDVVAEDGSLDRTTMLAATDEDEAVIRELAERYPPDPNSQSIRRVLRSGEAILIPDFPSIIESLSTSPEHAALIRKFNTKGMMVVPLIVREKVIAIMTLGCVTRSYTEEDLQLAKEIAWRAAQAVDNARLYAQTQQINIELERRVTERTAELEAFSYSVSHDLRAPLRAINGFSRMLIEDYEASLPEDARHYLNTIGDNAQQMGKLIDALLAFSRLGRQALVKTKLNPSTLAREVIAELRDDWQGRDIDFVIDDLPPAEADQMLLKQVFVNLLSNAIKFTRHRKETRIEIGYLAQDGRAETVYFIRDNGVGFNMDYVNKLFGVFQRLHRLDEYEGIGVGLALVQRIIQRHGGRIWAEAKPDQGATFYFTLDSESPTLLA